MKILFNDIVNVAEEEIGRFGPLITEQHAHGCMLDVLPFRADRTSWDEGKSTTCVKYKSTGGDR